MNRVVLDASVAAKWYLPERHESFSSEAAAVLQLHAAGRLDLLVPDLFWSELGNILWKAVLRLRTTRDGAVAAIQNASDLGLVTVPSHTLLNSAFEFAIEHKQTFYDSLYVALAVNSGTVLITADRHLVDALGAILPVRWLPAVASTLADYAKAERLS